MHPYIEAFAAGSTELPGLAGGTADGGSAGSVSSLRVVESRLTLRSPMGAAAAAAAGCATGFAGCAWEGALDASRVELNLFGTALTLTGSAEVTRCELTSV